MEDTPFTFRLEPIRALREQAEGPVAMGVVDRVQARLVGAAAAVKEPPGEPEEYLDRAFLSRGQRT